MSLLREAQCLNLVGSQRFSMRDLSIFGQFVKTKKEPSMLLFSYVLGKPRGLRRE